MKSSHIVLLTAHGDFFGQTRKPWVSLKVPRLIETARNAGYTVDCFTYHQVVNQLPRIKKSIILYSFSQKRNIRDYLRDLIYYLDDGSNLLIPSFDLLMCHEDKGYQELFKRKIGLSSLPALYFSSRRELDGYEIEFPAVVKQTIGTNGKRVFLVHDRAELERAVRRFEEIPFRDRVDLFRRKYLRPKKHFAEYPEYSNRTDYYQYVEYVKKERNFIIQPFVPDLSYDYRVLVLFDRYYIMKRRTRENDFRASGTKRFDFSMEMDPKLLDHAQAVYKKFDTPLLSLDIGVHGGRFHVFEFQALHFGVSAVVKSKGYYCKKRGRWTFETKAPDIEQDLMTGIIKFIGHKTAR
jgi:glutathione synthase/RimK-type ligase-like ATP-grasp enzyme